MKNSPNSTVINSLACYPNIMKIFNLSTLLLLLNSINYKSEFYLFFILYY